MPYGTQLRLFLSRKAPNFGQGLAPVMSNAANDRSSRPDYGAALLTVSPAAVEVASPVKTLEIAVAIEVVIAAEEIAGELRRATAVIFAACAVVG